MAARRTFGSPQLSSKVRLQLGMNSFQLEATIKWKLEADSWNLWPNDWRLKVRKQALELGNKKLQTGNWELGSTVQAATNKPIFNTIPNTPTTLSESSSLGYAGIFFFKFVVHTSSWWWALVQAQRMDTRRRGNLNSGKKTENFAVTRAPRVVFDCIPSRMVHCYH